MVMGADPFVASLWAPTGPMAGHPPSTTGRAPVDKAMANIGPCPHTVDPREELTGHLGEQIF